MADVVEELRQQEVDWCHCCNDLTNSSSNCKFCAEWKEWRKFKDTNPSMMSWQLWKHHRKDLALPKIRIAANEVKISLSNKI